VFDIICLQIVFVEFSCYIRLTRLLRSGEQITLFTKIRSDFIGS